VTELNRIAFVDLHFGAVDDRIALALTAFFVHDRDRALAIHHHQITDLRLHRLQSDKTDGSGCLGFQPRLLRNSRCRTADVEGTHGELRARLADGLRGDDADRLADVHRRAAGKVTAVAMAADADL
jgi:hypothetical protein